MHEHKPYSDRGIIRFFAFMVSPFDTFLCSTKGVDVCGKCSAPLVAPFQLDALWVKLLYVLPATLNFLIRLSPIGYFAVDLLVFFAFHHLLSSGILAFFSWSELKEGPDEEAYAAGLFSRSYEEKTTIFTAACILAAVISRFAL